MQVEQFMAMWVETERKALEHVQRMMEDGKAEDVLAFLQIATYCRSNIDTYSPTLSVGQIN